jgi:Tfp pilus assembly protein PilV
MLKTNKESWLSVKGFLLVEFLVAVSVLMLLATVMAQYQWQLLQACGAVRARNNCLQTVCNTAELITAYGTACAQKEGDSALCTYKNIPISPCATDNPLMYELLRGAHQVVEVALPWSISEGEQKTCSVIAYEAL